MELRDSPVSKTVIASPLIYRNIRYTIEIPDYNRFYVRIFKAPEIVKKYFTFVVVIRPVNIDYLKTFSVKIDKSCDYSTR